MANQIVDPFKQTPNIVDPFAKEVGFGENLKRTLVGAARDTAQATTELVEDITGKDIPDLPTIEQPTYQGGQAIRDISGFAIPFTGLAKGVSVLSKLDTLSKQKKVIDPT